MIGGTLAQVAGHDWLVIYVSPSLMLDWLVAFLAVYMPLNVCLFILLIGDKAYRLARHGPLGRTCNPLHDCNGWAWSVFLPFVLLAPIPFTIWLEARKLIRRRQ